MTDPQRLLDGAGDDVEVALLSSAKPDAPSNRTVRRTLAALGIAGGAAIAVGAAAAPHVAGGAAASLGKSTAVVLVKWVALAAVGGLALWGALDQLSADAAPVHAAVAPTARSLTDNASEALASRRHDHRSLARSFEADPGAGTEQGATPAAPRKRAQQPRAAGADELTAEVAALDAARRALADDPDAALAAIEAYNSKFKGGALGPEAEVVRIEALVRAGEKDRARALANAFLAKHPSSPLAQRVRSLVAGSD